jgi:hypothetical protein
MDNPTKTFTFSVAGNPAVFTFKPAEMWRYTAVDVIRFQSKAGPFTVDLNRSDAVAKPNEKKPFGQLQSTKNPDAQGFFFAQTKITDGLTKAQRDAARAQNQTAADPFGFIARYKYAIAVTLPDGTKAQDGQHNGEYGC